MMSFKPITSGRRIRGAHRITRGAAVLSAVAALSYLGDAAIVLTGKQPLMTTSDPLALALHAATGLSFTAARALSHLEGVATASALFWVFLLMSRMIASVRRGEAFALENADRLSSMGWVLLGLFCFHLLVNMFCFQLLVDMRLPTADVGPSPLWIELLAAGVLRAFAEMFREGAAMRDELEGTV